MVMVGPSIGAGAGGSAVASMAAVFMDRAVVVSMARLAAVFMEMLAEGGSTAEVEVEDLVAAIADKCVR